MKKISKYKVDKGIIFSIILFAIISVLSIYSALTLLDSKGLLTSSMNNLYIKQLLWYGIGFILAYFIMFIGNDAIIKRINILYIIGVLLLFLVLIFGATINEAKCWFVLPGIGNFQPSEFMKIILIIMLAKMINKFHEENPKPSIFDEFKFLLKVLLMVFIPSVLTFIEPDTGAVVMYLIITFAMLFIGGFRKRWFVITISVLVISLSSFLGLYFLNQDLFIDIFGTSFFYRMDRILNWSKSSGLQLTNSLTAIGSAGLFGHGFNKTPIYFPEMQTDFIFAVFTSNFGLIGAILLIILIIFFDINLITTVNKTTNMYDKYAIGGILAVLLFQQVYNISMTIGLLPIMGITLPFISYGGSSLLSYMILLGIIFNISNESLRFTNK